MTPETTLRHGWLLAKIMTVITLDAHKIQVLTLKTAFNRTYQLGKIPVQHRQQGLSALGESSLAIAFFSPLSKTAEDRESIRIQL
jgi:hypothetical protein